MYTEKLKYLYDEFIEILNHFDLDIMFNIENLRPYSVRIVEKTIDIVKNSCKIEKIDHCAPGYCEKHCLFPEISGDVDLHIDPKQNFIVAYFLLTRLSFLGMREQEENGNVGYAAVLKNLNDFLAKPIQQNILRPSFIHVLQALKAYPNIFQTQQPPTKDILLPVNAEYRETVIIFERLKRINNTSQLMNFTETTCLEHCKRKCDTSSTFCMRRREKDTCLLPEKLTEAEYPALFSHLSLSFIQSCADLYTIASKLMDGLKEEDIECYLSYCPPEKLHSYTEFSEDILHQCCRITDLWEDLKLVDSIPKAKEVMAFKKSIEKDIKELNFEPWTMYFSRMFSQGEITASPVKTRKVSEPLKIKTLIVPIDEETPTNLTISADYSVNSFSVSNTFSNNVIINTAEKLYSTYTVK